MKLKAVRKRRAFLFVPLGFALRSIKLMPDKRLNILFLSGWYPNRLVPTNGNFVQRHAEAVALQANVAALFVCSDNNCKQKFESVESTLNNVFTVNVYYKKVIHNIPVVSQFQKAIRYIQAHLKGLRIIHQKFNKIDVVHLNILYPAGIIALYLKLFKNTLYICTEHWTGYLPADGSYKGAFRKMLTKTIANKATYLVPVSKDLQIAMEGHGFKSNYEIVPNVVDIQSFYPLQHKTTNSPKRIIHISTLDDQQKNVSGILRAIKKLSEKNSDFELHIVGDNLDRNKLEQFAKDLGLFNKQVFFLGLKNKEELATLLRQSDFLVLFSNYENLPCVLIESIASGVPVIATKVGGIPEHITDKLGVLVNPNDEAGFENAMQWMLANYSTFDIAYMQKYAEEHFSNEKVGEQFNRIYLKTLS